MATLSGYHAGGGKINWTISGLGSPASSYSDFWVRSGANGAGSSYANWSDYNPNSYSTSYSTYHALGQTITGYGRFVKDGYPYSCDPTTGVSIYLPAPSPPTGKPIVSGDASSGRTINVSWSGVSEATGYKVYKNSGSGDYSWNYPYSADVGNVYKKSFTIDSEYTTYTIRVVPYNANGDGANGGTVSIKTLDETPPYFAQFYAYNIGTDNLSLYAQAYDRNGVGGTQSYIKDVNFYIYNGSWVSSGWKTVDSSGQASTTFTGLIANKIYSIYAIARDNALNTTISDTLSPKTLDNKPSVWVWNPTIVQNSNFIMTASNWNAFTSRINAYRQWYDNTKGTSIGQYSFTTASNGGVLYSYFFNQAIAAINAMNPPIACPATQVSGGAITAKILNDVATSLNSIS